jgi:hypothetical protein
MARLREALMRLSTRIAAMAVLAACGAAMGQVSLAGFAGIAKAQPRAFKEWKAWADSGGGNTTFTLPDGGVISRSVSLSSDDGATVRTATPTGPSGRAGTRADTWMRDGDTINHEGRTTLPGGRVVTRESSTTVQDGVVVRTGNATGPGGRAVTSTDTWIRAGNSVKHQGATTLPGGRVVSRESSRRISLESSAGEVRPPKVSANDTGGLAAPALERDPMAGGPAPLGGKAKAGKALPAAPTKAKAKAKKPGK